MKRLVLCTALGLLSFSSSVRSEDISSNAVRLFSRPAPNAASKLAGTGCLVEWNRTVCIITAYHVVTGSHKIYVCDAQGRPHDEIGAFATQAIISPTLDLCIFQCNGAGVQKLRQQPYHRSILKLSDKDPIKGERVVVVGNPRVRLFEPAQGRGAGQLFEPVNATAVGDVFSITPAGQVLPIEAASPANAMNIVVLKSNGITHGFSGGPLISDPLGAKTVSGILLGGDPADFKTTWGVSCTRIIDALKNQPGPFPPNAWPPAAFPDKVFSLREENEIQFPIEFPENGGMFAERINRVWTMETKIKLSKSGRVDGTTQTVTDTVLRGFTGKAVVYMCDEVGNVLHKVESDIYGVPVAIEKRRIETWEGQVPQEVLLSVRKIVIKHFHAPTDRRVAQALNDLVNSVRKVDFNSLKKEQLYDLNKP